MKDQVFSGRDVATAVELAARTLGLPPEGLQYVVLDPGEPGSLGRADRPARVAVLVQPGQPAGSAARSGPAHSERGVAAAPVAEPAARIREIVRTLAEAADVDLSAEVVEGADALTVRLEGGGRDLLLEDGGEPLQALEHLLQRIFGRILAPRRLVVACEGYRDVRADSLRERALELAEAVIRDGRPRSTEALNSYERRLVHVALSDHPRVRTFSVGEGGDRRVTVALREVGDAAAGTGGGPA